MNYVERLHEVMSYYDTKAADRFTTANDLRERGDIERATWHERIGKEWSRRADLIEGELFAEGYEAIG